MPPLWELKEKLRKSKRRTCGLQFSSWGQSDPRGERGTSLAVQWLRLHASIAGGAGLTPGWATKILYTPGCSKEETTYPMWKVRCHTCIHRIHILHGNPPLNLEICKRAGKPSRAERSHSLNFLLNNRTDFKYWIPKANISRQRRARQSSFPRPKTSFWLDKSLWNNTYYFLSLQRQKTQC